MRVGQQNGSTSGCATCEYPGSPARTQGNDGHFVTVNFTTCFNGNIDAGEQCDLGVQNGQPGVCCSSSCQYSAAGSVCRAAAGVCDIAETCSGSSSTCPPDAIEPATTVCRAVSAGDDCDVSENCDGTTVNCPADGVASAGTPCTSDGVLCTLDQCDGMNKSCQHPNAPAGTVCRAANGVCDVAETCSGTSPTCPVNGFLPNTTECRGATDVCDVAEFCTGTGANCPADGYASSTTVCRAAAGVCDREETCPGSGPSCPADGKFGVGLVCRAAAGACDIGERCDGVGNDCPSDALESLGAVCRSAAGVCDIEETCDGATADCPADAVEPATTACRAASAGSDCDLTEYCDGAAASCPSDGYQPDGTACEDGIPNTSPDQCQGGVCDSGPIGCPSGPASGCHLPTAAGAAQLMIKYDSAYPTKAKFKFKWKKGQNTDIAEFGDPVMGTTAYSVCVYHDANLIFEAGIAPGTGWSAGAKGPSYKDKLGTQGGITKIGLKFGPDGKAKVFAKGDNKAMMMPLSEFPPYAPPLQFTVQVLNSNNECWEAQFDDAVNPFTANTDKLLKVKSE